LEDLEAVGGDGIAEGVDDEGLVDEFGEDWEVYGRGLRVA
jgi:hypothetical protein